MKEKLKPFLVRLDEETKNKLEAKAKAENRSINNYIVNLIKLSVSKASLLVFALLLLSTPSQSEVKHEVAPEYQQEVSIGKFGSDIGNNGGYDE